MNTDNALMAVKQSSNSIQERVDALISKMTLKEKIGQMCQLPGNGENIPDDFAASLRNGLVGSVLNEANLELINEAQRICVEDTRLGIPLLIGRDVIHGFKTIFPIPLGQAASWDPEVIKQGARVAAIEAASRGINWTFAPMIDISRDARWGRIAESLGEDPYLCSELGKAMVAGFQGDDLSTKSSIAACAKHFAGYGASEGGRDYAAANIPENEMRNVYLRPFNAVADAGVASFMSAFCDVNGIPATGNKWLLDEVLRKEWNYAGVLVSDWDSVIELSVHGFTENDKQAAFEAVTAGIDMEMASTTYINHLEELISEGKVSVQQIDEKVARILALKFALGLFENPYTDPSEFPAVLNDQHRQDAKECAVKSCVLLKNHQNVLPLSKEKLNSIALIGPLADDDYEPLGTWIFDGEAQHTITLHTALKNLLASDVSVNYSTGLTSTRSTDETGFAQAIQAADNSDAVVVVVGEESFMSGEAHSRANIDLPGKQEQLIAALKETGKPVIVVIMAGRPLTIEKTVGLADAVLYAWHPGSMGGPAIADLLFGLESPSGKLPVTFPRAVGQIPIYYSQKNTGRPATDENVVRMDEVPVRAPQTSLGMTSFHLDAGFRPLFPFGFGLSYGNIKYSKLALSATQIKINESIEITAEVCNSGDLPADETVQLYIRDLVGNVTRPIKELKGFQSIHLEPGETKQARFILHTDDLAFYGRNNKLMVEAGKFHVWVGASSDADLQAEFEISNA